MQPTTIVWKIHGSPKVDGCGALGSESRCYICGDLHYRGKPVVDWMGSNFTDQNRARNPLGVSVCEACCYISSRTSPVLGRPAKEGKGAGANFRNVSHLWEDGWSSPEFGAVKDESSGLVVGYNGPSGLGYVNASKGEKPLLREFIERDHTGNWFAAIGESGQKHVLLFASVNGPGRSGVVLFEDSSVTIPRDTSLIGSVADLLTAGANKESIESGEYTSLAWQLCEEKIRWFEEQHRRERGSGWFSLAVWLAQRDEEQVRERTESAPKKGKTNGSRSRKADTSGHDKRAGGDVGGVLEDAKPQRAEALAEVRAAPTPEPVRSNNDRAVAGEIPVSARDCVAEQLDLFGTGSAGPIAGRKRC